MTPTIDGQGASTLNSAIAPISRQKSSRHRQRKRRHQHRHWHDLLPMRVLKFHHELDFLEVLLPDKFQRAPGVLKVEGRLRVFTPTARETEVSFVSRVLQQYFHQVAFDCLIFFFFVSLNFPFPLQQAELEPSGLTITSGAMGSTLRAAILYGSA